MYPKLWEQEGVSYPSLLAELVSIAEERFNIRQGLKRLL
jgi:hypothetical protein